MDSSINTLKRLAAQLPQDSNSPLPEGAEQRLVDELEAALGWMPHELRAWLMYTNAPNIGPGGIYGICPHNPGRDIQKIQNYYRSWHRLGWIPLANDGCGNDYVAVKHGNSHAIAFVEQSVDPEHLAYRVASRFDRFLAFLFAEELGETRWPFDAEYVIANDPDILDVPIAPLPWET